MQKSSLATLLSKKFSTAEKPGMSFEVFSIVIGGTFLELVQLLSSNVSILSATLGPMIVAVFLGARRGLLSFVLFVCFETIVLNQGDRWGLPVAANSGYLIGIGLAILVVGLLSEKVNSDEFRKIFALYFLGSVLFIVCGMIVTAFYISLSDLTFAGVLPFFINEAINAVIYIIFVHLCCYWLAKIKSAMPIK